MKVSLNTIRDLVDQYQLTQVNMTAIGTDAIIEKIGAQLGAVEETIDFGSAYDGVLIARIVSCQKHPNADKLNICMIDDGGEAVDVDRDDKGLVQVVCGATNVHEGMTVAWLPPGSTVPESIGKEPFVLGARVLRGVISNGMLASPKELALGDSHDSILDIDQDLQPGASFAEAFKLTNDTVIDIENKMFTHRPDCFGFLGVARELAGIQGIPFSSPEWYVTQPQLPKPEVDQLPLHINNELPELVPRFTAVVMSNIQVKTSPVWLQIELAKIGARPINNIVDYTNYFMQLTGQPLHAYDYDKVKTLSENEATLSVRYPEAEESVLLLNGKHVQPRSEAILIATDKQAIGIGGVMGGKETEVDAQTTNIIIESANFNMYSIRRTAMANGLFTDAVTRFNKGQSPLQNTAVLAKIVDEIRNHASGKVASDIIDSNNLPTEVTDRQSLHAPVHVTTSFINQRLGIDLVAEQMQQLLQNVEFAVEIQDDGLLVTAPFWRTDIALREDVVEEVGRLYGFDKLPLVLPSRVIKPSHKDALMSFKTNIRKCLVGAGANEILSYSFVPGKVLENAGQNTDQAFTLSNALSPELHYYRLSLMPSLLEKIHPNSKAGYEHFALFELGKGHLLDHIDDAGLPIEFEMLDLVVSAGDKALVSGAAYYQAKLYLETLAADCGVGLLFEPFAEASPYAVARPFDYTRAALVRDEHSGEVFGVIGEFTASTRKSFKLPKYTAGFSINPKHLLHASTMAANSYAVLPRFPKVTQDVTFTVPAGLAYWALYDFVRQQVIATQAEHSTSSVSVIDIYQPEAADTKSVTLRLQIANHKRTLTDKEVSTLLETVSNATQEQFGVKRS